MLASAHLLQDETRRATYSVASTFIEGADGSVQLLD